MGVPELAGDSDRHDHHEDRDVDDVKVVLVEGPRGAQVHAGVLDLAGLGRRVHGAGHAVEAPEAEEDAQGVADVPELDLLGDVLVKEQDLGGLGHVGVGVEVAFLSGSSGFEGTCLKDGLQNGKAEEDKMCNDDHCKQDLDLLAVLDYDSLGGAVGHFLSYYYMCVLCYC